MGCPEKVDKTPEAEPPSEEPAAAKTTIAPKKVEEPPKKRAAIDPNAARGNGYYITYPKDWDFKPNYMGTDTMALSKPEGKSDTFMENVNVVFENTGAPVSPKKYFDMSQPMMKKMLTDFKIESDRALTTKSGEKAHEMVYRHRMGEMKIKVKATFFTKGSTGYVVTCSALGNDAYKKFEKDFDEITGSFVIQ